MNIKKEFNLDLKQIAEIEDMLMAIPTKICRNMDNKFITHILKDHSKDLAKHHFIILKMLQKQNKFYVSEIVQMLGITKSQMTASIDKLLKLGYVERETDIEDRRKIYISITLKGEEITQKINSRIKEKILKDMNTISIKDQEDLFKGLQVLTKLCALNK